MTHWELSFVTFICGLLLLYIMYFIERWFQEKVTITTLFLRTEASLSGLFSVTFYLIKDKAVYLWPC